MDMPRPGVEHEKLKLFAGTWNGEETIYPSPMDPAKMEISMDGTKRAPFMEGNYTRASC